MPDVTPSPLPPRAAEEIVRRIHPDARVTEVITRTGGQSSTVIEVRCGGAVEPVIIRIPQSAYGYLVTGVLDPEATNPSSMRRQFDKKLWEFSHLGGDRALREGVEVRLAEHGVLFGRCPGARLCHNDFHEGNVLVARRAAGWTMTGFIHIENAIGADPLMDLARADYYSMHGDRVKREALHEGYGPLPADGADRIGLYRLYHAVELWDWFASIGRTAPLDGIAEDIGRMTA